ncbi:hypothetical protein SAMN03159355_04528 [Pseudomonas sp. NFPP10]|nr:hypothetical protein SAMN03159465_05560 [Pseudomonas sp. NFPP12]SEM27756.1 hypothetical protein SAMN03159355_04528 [Pseudomonas sp. NFPP10]SFK08395.1 hypothetical protein SAMN03159416_04944 [Pseudomonas sp. NFPP08]SFN26345.1 hypothetical protein SAMN03159476_04575 [Pseudomonas sp. NFPP05]SFX96363.1 hypothetical protein SAMN03159479_05095 [Pseudomonas sp. NFPP09]
MELFALNGKSSLRSRGVNSSSASSCELLPSQVGARVDSTGLAAQPIANRPVEPSICLDSWLACVFRAGSQVLDGNVELLRTVQPQVPGVCSLQWLHYPIADDSWPIAASNSPSGQLRDIRQSGSIPKPMLSNCDAESRSANETADKGLYSNPQDAGPWRNPTQYAAPQIVFYACLLAFLKSEPWFGEDQVQWISIA